ncbi:MAG: glycoside hydrolase family 2 protein [Elusimicrobia bacterium]|nr:glycoside hydrolase family 2 protein [Elusimicrobiota bacterium]
MLLKKTLNGSWQFRKNKENNWERAVVPGCIQMDLMALGKLPDPFFGTNEIQFIGMEADEWSYRKTFIIEKEELSYSQIKLVFEGIDTFCDVYLNDKHLGRTENMFIPYIYDVKSIIKQGKNILVVDFDSPIKTIKKIEKSSFMLKSAFETARPYVRKAQYSYGWDWGPRIAQTGIWRDVYLEFIDKAKITNPFIFTEGIKKDIALMNIECDILDYCNGEKLDLETIISFHGRKIFSFKKQLRGVKGENKISRKIKIRNPKLWYPNGMGEQNLYDIQYILYFKNKKVDSLRTHFGIRMIKLVQEKDSKGRGFLFEINGIRTFCKGANWIPADSLLPRITKKDYYDFIAYAKNANMNMLRVWGGGIYENSAFYDACDRMGIMIWQDFMYACAEYPDNLSWFRKLAEQEAEIIVKKLRNHPSIILWCGNNENSMMLHYHRRKNRPKILGSYIYERILPKICTKNDGSRPYWISSPYGGKEPNSENEGDRHSWDIYINWLDYEYYKKDTGRFISEFGFQAMPTWKTVLSFTEEKDRSILSQVILCHNKIIKGHERQVKFLFERIGLPRDFKSFVYLTQFNQAEAIKTGVEHWRNRKFKTSGALFWQFNDCWPVASWSCIDYYKRKKALYYYSKKFFANVLPYLKFENNRIQLSIVNDFNEDKNAKITVEAYKLNGKRVLRRNFKTKILKNNVTKVKVFHTSEFINKNIGYIMMKETDSYNTVPSIVNKELIDTIIFADVIVDNKTYSNYLVFDKFRNLDIQEARIKTVVKGREMEINVDKPVFGLFIEPENDVDVSDNSLILRPGKTYRVSFSGNPGNIKTFDLKRLTLQESKSA